MNEQLFVERATQFLRPRIAYPPADFGADTELIGSGLLDSLLVLEFFFFLEELKGSVIDADRASIDVLSTVRSAYSLIGYDSG